MTDYVDRYMRTVRHLRRAQTFAAAAGLPVPGGQKAADAFARIEESLSPHLAPETRDLVLDLGSMFFGVLAGATVQGAVRTRLLRVLLRRGELLNDATQREYVELAAAVQARHSSHSEGHGAATELQRLLPHLSLERCGHLLLLARLAHQNGNPTGLESEETS